MPPTANAIPPALLARTVYFWPTRKWIALQVKTSMNIQQELSQILPEKRIRARYIDVVSYASDAGFYHLIPKAVVQPENEAEIISLFRFSQRQFDKLKDKGILFPF